MNHEHLRTMYMIILFTFTLAATLFTYVRCSGDYVTAYYQCNCGDHATAFRGGDYATAHYQCSGDDFVIIEGSDT